MALSARATIALATLKEGGYFAIYKAYLPTRNAPIECCELRQKSANPAHADIKIKGVGVAAFCELRGKGYLTSAARYGNAVVYKLSTRSIA